jgi:alanyl-tRNA synthetase
MTTRRLHYDDPLALDFEARVFAHATYEGRPSVILADTLFYPESGGQMGDHGHLGEARVVDVQLDRRGVVHHLVEGPLPEVGATVAGRIDGRRRREHMALHTGQHCLSRAVLELFGAVTRSSRLGASACTLDVDRAGLSMDQLAEAAARVQDLVDEDRPVRQYFPSDAELVAMDLRKPPPETDRIRVVRVEGEGGAPFDITPCGGTHVTHTAQIQLLRVEGVERYKGGSRITFSAGPRARRHLAAQAAWLEETARPLRCAPAEVPQIVARLRDKLDATSREAGTLRAELTAQRVGQLVEAADGGDVFAVLEGVPPKALAATAQRLAEGARLVALATPVEGGGLHAVLARGPERDLDAGGLFEAVAAELGGRGGGRPTLAQGRLDGAPGAFEAAVRQALEPR